MKQGRRPDPRGQESESLLLLYVGGGLCVGVLYGIWVWLDSLGVLDSASQTATTAAESAASWWTGALPWILQGIAVALAVVLVVLLMRLRNVRREARRREAHAVLAAALGPVMPADWTSQRLVVRRWRGDDPIGGIIALTPACPDHEPVWRDTVEAVITRRLGVPVVTIDWPSAGTSHRRPSRVVAWSVSAETEEKDPSTP